MSVQACGHVSGYGGSRITHCMNAFDVYGLDLVFHVFWKLIPKMDGYGNPNPNP